MAAVVLVGGDCVLGIGLCLDLGMSLRTDGYPVLWERSLLRRWILARSRLGYCFILSHG